MFMSLYYTMQCLMTYKNIVCVSIHIASVQLESVIQLAA